jgi:predicted dienelactone hydrolase
MRGSTPTQFFLVAVIALMTLAIPAGAEQCTIPAVGYRVMHIGGRVVAVWYPTRAAARQHAYGPTFSSVLALNAPPSTACGRPVPLVVFSHGDLGCGLQSVVFTEQLARSGYVVAAPDHADATLCHTVPPQSGLNAQVPPQPNIFAPDAWDDTTRTDRRQDLEAVIDTLLGDGEFRKVIDAERIGAAGHSLGGYTVVGLAGGWQTWLDRRIRAVLAFSPYVMPFQAKQTIGEVKVPLMYQGGTEDVGITPFLQGPKGAYAQAHRPAYFLVLRNAAHFAWVNCGNEHTTASCFAKVTNQRLMTEYGIAFFDLYLKGIQEPLLRQQNPALASYEFRQ